MNIGFVQESGAKVKDLRWFYWMVDQAHMSKWPSPASKSNVI